MNAAHVQATCAVFRTAYHIALSNRPFSDHFGLLDLQCENGVDIGIGLHSRYSGAQIVDHIAEQMRKKVCQRIQTIKGKVSVLIDESTSLGSITTLIVYLKCETDKNFDPHFVFLELIELPNQRADTIVQHLLKCLSSHGFDYAYLRKHLVAFASDGASVMLGRKSGVAKQLSERYPNILTWHCLNHRLELAVGDTVSDVRGVNHFQAHYIQSITPEPARAERVRSRIGTASGKNRLCVKHKMGGQLLSYSVCCVAQFRLIKCSFQLCKNL